MRPIWRSTIAMTIALSLATLSCGPAAPPPTPAPSSSQGAPSTPAAAPSRPEPTAKPVPTSAGATPAPTARTAADERLVAEFYRGKTVRLLVGYAPGGGYDTYARVIARHLGKHIPGSPSIVVENMPGAGSMLALNHLYNVGPKDGTLIGSVDGGLALQQLFGAQGVEFDMTRLLYLGAPSRFTYVLAVTKVSGISSVEQVMGPGGQQLVLGATPKTALETASVLMRDVLGANVKVVTGYDGTAKIWLAMDGGEVHGYFATWDTVKAQKREAVDSGQWLIIAQWTDQPLKDLPGVPDIQDYAKTDDQRQLLRLGVTVPNLFARPYVMAPGVPQDRAEALAQAFSRTMADPDFLSDAEKAKLDIAPLTGPQVRNLVQEFLGMPADQKSRLQKFFPTS